MSDRPHAPQASSTPWNDAGTTKSAQTLAKHLRVRGITSQHLQTMHPSVLAHHALIAGVQYSPDMISEVQYHLNPGAGINSAADLFKP